MTDFAALYAAILHDPLADTPRLVLADWLDDNGDPERAEYIRLACQLAREGEEPCTECDGDGIWIDGRGNDFACPACNEWGTGPLTRRRDELERRHGERWLRDAYQRFPDGVWNAAMVSASDTRLGEPWIAPTFDRGFLSVIEIDAGSLLSPGFAGALARACPLTAVQLTRRTLSGGLDLETETHFWFSQNRQLQQETRQDMLPHCIFERLKDVSYYPEIGSQWEDAAASYRTRATALDAASRAVISHCRAAAGLPAIQWESEVAHVG